MCKGAWGLSSRLCLTLALGCGGQALGAVNIQNDIYNLSNKSSSNVDTFYSNNMGTTWSTFGTSFTQSYANGTLIIGNSTQSPNKNSGHWFGSGGTLGFITANFKAKEVFLTGTLGTGNAARTGGGANINLEASGTTTVSGAKLHLNAAGGQSSNIYLGGNTVTIKDSQLTLEGNLGGGGTNRIHLGNKATNTLNLSNTSLHFALPAGGLVAPELVIQTSSNASKIEFSSITGAFGYITFDSNRGNYQTFSANTVNASDLRIKSKDAVFNGDIRGGSFKLGSEAGTYFNAQTVLVKGNSKIKADSFSLTTVEMHGGANANAANHITLELDSKNPVEIDQVRNSGFVFGQVAGYGATLKATAPKVGTVVHNNFTGGNRLFIEATEALEISKLMFNSDGIGGSNGLVGLKGKDIYLQSLADCENSCTGAAGIRALNTLSASGENFYGGTIEAIGLPTAGSNSTLDLNGIKGTTFIDSLTLKTATFKSANFHLNNLSVQNGNSYSELPSNVGKSFINYLSMNIGTSGFADGSNLRLTGGGDILNFNLIDSRPTARWDISGVKETSINHLRVRNSQIWLGGAHINSMEVQTSQLGFGIFDFVKDATVIRAGALNINNLLHLKKGSAYNGYMEIELGRTYNQASQSYLATGLDSAALQAMNQEQLKELLDSRKPDLNDQNQNASGTYLSTTDGRSFVLLPGILSTEKIENSATQAENSGGILVEHKPLIAGTLNNYGLILLDTSFFGMDKGNSKDATLKLKGNLNNYNTIDIGANARVNLTGNLNNYGKLIFRIQADPKNEKDKEVKNGLLNIQNGSTSFDISPGSSGAFQADIADAKSLANLKLATAGQAADRDPSTYKLITISGGSIKYSYTQGEYTTIFEKDKISTSKANGACISKDCVDTSNNGYSQETAFTTTGFQNPWDVEKAATDTSGSRIENAVGENDNQGNLIQKPSQSDKKPADSQGYNGFGHVAIQQDSNKTEAEKEIDRGYDYAQERMKASFGLTYKGASIDSKYLEVEKVVTDNLVGFRILRRDMEDFSGKAETPLCQAGSSSFDCALYMEAGGNNSWIKAIKEGSANGYEILKDLFYDENSSLLFLVNLDQTLASSRNLAYFLEVARTLDSSFQHVSNLRNKGAALQSLSLSMESARVSRLTKVAINQHGHHGINQANQTKLAMDKKKKELAVQVAQRLKRDNERRMEARGQ